MDVADAHKRLNVNKFKDHEARTINWCGPDSSQYLNASNAHRKKGYAEA